MYIRSIHIYGFGKYHDFCLDLKPGFNVIEGMNEAGKSTLLAFIKAVLFGFENRRSPAMRYEPLEGGSFGGNLLLVDEGGAEYQIERTGKRTSLGSVRVTMPDGTEHGDEILAALLAGMSPTFYANIFAFGLTELSYLTTLTQEEVTSYLYHAGTNLSLPTLKKTWHEEQERLFKRRGAQPSLNQLLTQLEEIEQQIESLQRENEYYNDWLAKREELDHEINQLEKQMVLLSNEQKQWLKSKEAYALQKEWKVCQEQASQLPLVDSFPENGVRRLEDIEQRILTASVELEETRQRLDKLIIERDAIILDPRIEQLQIEWVGEQKDRWQQKRERLEIIEKEVAWLDRELQRAIQQLGLEWTEQRLRQFDVSLSKKEIIRDHRRRMEPLQAGLQAIAELLQTKQAELEAYRQQADQVREQVSALRSEQQLVELEARLTACQRLLLEIETIKQQEAWLNLQLSDAQRSSTVIGPNRLLIFLVLIGLLGTVAITIVNAPFSWIALISLAIALIASAAIYVTSIRKGPPQQATDHPLQKEAHALQKKRIETERRLSRLVDSLGAGFDLSSLQQALIEVKEQREHRLKQTDKLVWLEELLEQLERERQQLNDRQQTLLKQQEQEQAEWQALLDEDGLSERLSPDGVLEVLALVEQSQQLLLKRDREQEIQVSLQAEWQGFHDKMSAVWQQIELPDQPDDPLRMLVELKQVMTREKQRAEAKEILEKESEAEHARLQMKERFLEKLREQRLDLLRSISVTDSESFRRLYRQMKEREQLEERMRMLELTMDTADVDERIKKRIDEYPLDYIEQQANRYATKGAEAQMRLKQLADERGQYTNRLRQLEHGEQLSQLKQQRQECLTAAQTEAKRWITLRLANRLLAQTQESYEARKQPQVLREASALFSEMTAARYQRVLSPIGEERLLVEREDGLRMEPQYLSRGAREQLFLCLRFGLIKESSKTSRPPIILDDIFVNFDDNRKRAALDCLHRFTSEHQILYFTCQQRAGQMVDELNLSCHHARLE
ncbi:hypothetical protein BEP19_16520 [Ammoniphilus oxalaticus]|uniref:YhaN AAA domain-containing protein n=1 Tax=Ammoniphilus oxalaticus TaxID=66863 RepID=A0A419SQN0_9BACL|nr:AAA family ATPase [Ammoniphilus oxalaticus]RKD26800.1 hypothetical protein BEP19_16520 [Ammoniphilus oxalaticus]